jgi:hypothetical protein
MHFLVYQIHIYQDGTVLTMHPLLKRYLLPHHDKVLTKHYQKSMRDVVSGIKYNYKRSMEYSEVHKIKEKKYRHSH